MFASSISCTSYIMINVHHIKTDLKIFKMSNMSTLFFCWVIAWVRSTHKTLRFHYFSCGLTSFSKQFMKSTTASAHFESINGSFAKPFLSFCSPRRIMLWRQSHDDPFSFCTSVYSQGQKPDWHTHLSLFQCLLLQERSVCDSGTSDRLPLQRKLEG